VLKVWDWKTGKEKHDIPIQEAVEPFIVVKGKKRRWLDETEMGDEHSTARVRKKGRKGKSKGKSKEVPEQDVDMEEVGDDGPPAPAIIENAPEDGHADNIRPEVEEVVLAIHKVDSFETSRGKHLVFNAIGYAPYPSPPSRAPLTSCLKLYISVCLQFPFTRRYFLSNDPDFRL